MKINPYLRFNDEKCREAMNFYQSILGGELTFQTVGESPMAKEMPKETHNRIMHATLKNEGGEFFGSDMMRDKAVIGDHIALAIDCKSEEELRSLFDKLSAGGEAFMAPEEAFWGAFFAMTTDKYGVEWMLNYYKDKK